MNLTFMWVGGVKGGMGKDALRTVYRQDFELYKLLLLKGRIIVN